MNEELGYVLETIRFKTSIYRDKKKRNLTFNDDDYYSNILNEYITNLQQENSQLKRENEALKQTHEYDLNMIDNVKGQCVKLQNRINKALKKINNIFDEGNEDSVIDDLLELDKILNGEKK